MSNENVALSLKQACQDFTEIISSLSDEQFLASMNDWSPRDVMAHLIGWNGLMMQSSLSILAGEAPSYYEDAPNDYSHINAGYINKFSSQSKQELLAELKSSMETFEAFIHSLSAEELTVSHGVVHYSGSPATVTRIINSLASDYQHHTREIIEWLTNNGTWSRAK
ncbi:MAG TPA: ClbS/DfsB family four-helix bundle protein [Anaerolineales bacterium]|nr:ClbS/DfsB family four-helix bundle protein [Anaerolineales bacterium]